MAIKVRATQIGYYNLRRYREGASFYINKESDFSKRWMVRLKDKKEESDVYEDEEKPEPVKKPSRSLKRPQKEVDDIQALDAITERSYSQDDDVI